MKANNIKFGATYRNAGAGRTQRRVIGIGPEYAPTMAHDSDRPDGWAGVEYMQRWKTGKPWSDWQGPRRIWLDSFAAWAGSEVME